MTESLQIWLFGGFASAFIVIGGALLHHMLHCKGNTEAISDLKEDLKENIRPEIMKLRNHYHEQQNALLVLDGKVGILQERTK